MNDHYTVISIIRYKMHVIWCATFSDISVIVKSHQIVFDQLLDNYTIGLFGWLFLRINVDLAIFQPYLDLEAGDNQSLKIQVARLGIETRSSCSASQELNHSATAAPNTIGN